MLKSLGWWGVCSPAGPREFFPNFMNFGHLSILAAASTAPGTCPTGCAVHLPDLVQRENRFSVGKTPALATASASASLS